MWLPRILVLDDLFGRDVHSGRNPDRESLCATFLWRDITGDGASKATNQVIQEPSAEVVFCRAQTPACAAVGDVVENDVDMALQAVRTGWEQHVAPNSSSSEVLAHCSSQENPRWTMLLLDLCFYTGTVTKESNRAVLGMPAGRKQDDKHDSYFGLTLLDAIHASFPELPIFILSSKPRREVSLEFSRRGALGFIDRTDNEAPLLVNEAIWHHGLLPDLSGEIAGDSVPLLLALREARRASHSLSNVLIRGERGTGKELMARYIHRCRLGKGITATDKNRRLRPEAEPPFVAVNSAALSPNLFASELFGIESRTATGVDGKAGLIESASGGMLFFDEIGDMAPEVQSSVLRVIQDREVTRVGGRKSKSVDVRFLSATNIDIEGKERGFRPDLLDRLRQGGTVWLPPLRSRCEDIPLLVERFTRDAEAKRPGAMHREVTPEALELLMDHDWPGNIRELESVVFSAVSRYPDVEHLVPGHLQIKAGRHPSTPASVGSTVPVTSDRAPVSEVGDESITTPELIEILGAFRADPGDARDWAGRLEELQGAYARAVAVSLRAALVATLKPTIENPDGDVLIHPAMKLLTGDSRLTAVKAADLIKRLLGLAPDSIEDLLRDPVLAAAYESALRIRPRSGGKKP